MSWFNELFTHHPEQQTVSAPPGKARRSIPPGGAVKSSKPAVADAQKLPQAILQNFVPLRNLDAAVISSLTYNVDTYPAEAVIFNLGEKSPSIPYLLDGEVEMQPDSDSHYSISAGSEEAHLPLNSGKRFGATAVARTETKILNVSADLTSLWTVQQQEITCVELMDIELPEAISDSQFFNSFAQAYRENKLQLPSLPNVALKLKEAVAHDIGAAEAAEIIQLDAPIVSNLIQVANSPLYAPVAPITNCIDAVTRLGLNAARNLVLGISLKQLFKCQDRQLMKSMLSLWKNSVYVSSLSFVLADESGCVNPEDALLAGLVCDIGIVPLLHFTEQYPDKHPDLQQLRTAIPYLRGPVGSLVLHTLGFTEELTRIPHYAEDWFHDSGDKLTIIDIVILAKLHSYIGTGKTTSLPHINTIPAYSKLKDGKLTPDFSLNILRLANKRISAAMNILG